MVREVASKTNDLAGDGTTTATVLAASILWEGARIPWRGHELMDLQARHRSCRRRRRQGNPGASQKVKSSGRSPRGTIAANGDATGRLG